jgi:hypothetical protein
LQPCGAYSARPLLLVDRRCGGQPRKEPVADDCYVAKAVATVTAAGTRVRSRVFLAVPFKRAERLC